MPCEHTLRVRRLAVDDPAALNEQHWKAHLQHCAECRHERHALERSLAVFRQLEAQQPEEGLSGPSWESFSQALARSQRRRQLGLRLRAPLAAASLLAAVSTGALLWPMVEGTGSAPSPARIVRLQPEQERHLQRVLYSTLSDTDTPPGSRSSHEVDAAPEPSPARFAVRGLEPQVVAPPVMATGFSRTDDRAEAGRADAAPAPQAVAEGADANTRPARRSDYVSPFGTPPGQQVVRQERERAPVLLFRSLQQRQARRPPIQVLPAVSPMPADAGLSAIRSLLSPRPIR